MSSIYSLIFNNHILQLEGRNLIITGNNGAGKTRFLNDLTNDLAGRLDNTNSKQQEILKQQLKSTIDYGIKNFHSSLEFNEHDSKHLYNIFENDLNSIDFVFSTELNAFKNQLKKKMDIFYKNKNEFININSKDRLKKQNQDKLLVKVDPNNKVNNQKEFYYHAPEHIEKYIKTVDILINTYISKKKNMEIILSSHNKNHIFFFDASRVPRMDFSLGVFKSYDDFLDSDPLTNIEDALEAYLIHQKTELMSLMEYREIQGIKAKQINTIEKWFIKIESDLKWILENKSTELSFTKDGYKVLIKQEEKSFSFDQLSSGFKAIFNIYANLLMRAQIQKTPPEELFGIAIIDEIDVHLHISLQKKVLPFLIQAFPKIQFIVSTHSPFVITSTNNDTVVYDISSGEFFEEDLSQYSYESVIKGLFHVNPISSETKESIEILKKLLNEDQTNYENIRSIIKDLIQLEKNDLLDKKVKNLYLQAINLLADHNQLEDLDV